MLIIFELIVIILLCWYIVILRKRLQKLMHYYKELMYENMTLKSKQYNRAMLNAEIQRLTILEEAKNV